MRKRKEICKRCNENFKGWFETDNEDWEENDLVYCPEAVGVIPVEEKDMSFCKYYLEQMLFNENAIFCECDSYNLGGGTKPEVVLELPNGFMEHKERRTVCVDACIADTIKHLWDNDIETEGCCCGHNKAKPNVIIPEGYDDEWVKRIEEIIREVDKREWQILQWKLQVVNEKDD